jgi:ribosome-associated toxin RatA of RatAB toxin-antitoxin module
MPLEQSVVIAAHVGELFALTQDYARRLEWDPFLSSAQLVDGASAAGVGVRAYCVWRAGFGMETEYVSFNAPRATAVRMTRGPWFLKSFAGAWRFEETAPGQTRVVFSYHFQTWPGWLAGFVAPLASRILAWEMHQRLLALKRAVEERGLLADRAVVNPFV